MSELEINIGLWCYIAGYLFIFVFAPAFIIGFLFGRKVRPKDTD